MDGRSPKLKCDFCGKADSEVAKLVAGPGVGICDQCVALASEITNPPQAPRSIITLETGENVTVRQGVTESLTLAGSHSTFAPFTLPDGRLMAIRSSTIQRVVEAKERKATAKAGS